MFRMRGCFPVKIFAGSFDELIDEAHCTTAFLQSHSSVWPPLMRRVIVTMRQLGKNLLNRESPYNHLEDQLHDGIL
jgi:hypothetical protein